MNSELQYLHLQSNNNNHYLNIEAQLFNIKGRPFSNNSVLVKLQYLIIRNTKCYKIIMVTAVFAITIHVINRIINSGIFTFF